MLTLKALFTIEIYPYFYRAQKRSQNEKMYYFAMDKQ